MKSQSKATKSSESQRVLLRVTLDGKSSMRLLEGLCKKFQLKRSPLVTFMVNNLRSSKQLQGEFKEFYLNKWPALEPRKIDTGQLLSIPQDVDDEIKKLSWGVLPDGNKSETLRVLIHFYAEKNKVSVDDKK